MKNEIERGCAALILDYKLELLWLKMTYDKYQFLIGNMSAEGKEILMVKISELLLEIEKVKKILDSLNDEYFCILGYFGCISGEGNETK